MKKMYRKNDEMSSDMELSDSEEEYKPLRFKSNLSSKKTNKPSEPYVDFCSFTLGAFLAAPFMVFVCSAEDMLSGSKKATGLVFIAASAPSCGVKVFFLIFQGLNKTSIVSRCLMMYMLVVAGLMCVAMSQTSYNLRYVGVCFASLGMAIGEVHMLSISSQKLHKTTLTSYLAGTAGGGLLSTIVYVAMTCWSDVNPRVSSLISLVWPTMYLLAFAVFHMERLKHLGERFTSEPRKPARHPRSLCIRQFLGVWKALDVLSFLFVSNFSVFLSLGAILTTLVFTHEKDLFSREDYQHYILSSIIGQFFGRSAMALLLAKKPDIRATPFLGIGLISSLFFMFLLFFSSWHRFMYNIWPVLTICVLQGIGLGIISTISYHHIARDTNSPHIELLLITASLCEWFGMLCAGLIGLHTEPSLFKHCFEIKTTAYCLTRVTNAHFWMNGK